MIELREVSRRFGARDAVDRLTLTVEAGEILVLIGPSGSGKSTTLRMINRLIERSAGTIRFDGRDIDDFAPEQLRRRMGYAIQSVGLFPHWTVARNIAAVPVLLGWTRARTRARVEELLALLQLDPEVASRYPHQLSGGQAQRVGVARALAADPDVLLMDEPFGALDPITRDALQAELARIHRATGKTVVFVTHDMQEALRLASRIALLDRGRLVQLGTPRDLLAAPANDFVRAFVGEEDAALRLLALETVASRLRPGEAAEGPPLPEAATLRQALAAMLERGVERLPVADAEGRALGAIRLADLARR